jgi:hypothetical protein
MGNRGVIQVSGKGDIRDLRQRATTEIYTVGENFKRQLLGMFSDKGQPADDPAIRERLAKASGYFQEKFTALLTPYLENVEVETDNKEIRKKISDTVKQLREETAVKLAAVESCRDGFSPERYLRALSAAAIDTGETRPKTGTALYAEKDVGHPELFDRLREWRKGKAATEGLAQFQVMHQKTLVQIAVHLPDSIAALKKVKGIGSRLAELYGEELTTMVADYRREHGIQKVFLPEPAITAPLREHEKAPLVKEDTKKASLALFERGLTLPSIAAERGLTVTTIEGHLAFFVSSGKLEIGQVVTDEKRRIIAQKIADSPEKSLKELKMALGEDCSYGDIKLVIAHLKHSENQ